MNPSHNRRSPRSRQIVTLRVPDAWAGHVTSARVRSILRQFRLRPGKLPPDPGAGDTRISLSLPCHELAGLSSALGSESTVLRRLIAWGMGFPPAVQAAGRRAVKEPGLAEILADYRARIAELKGQSRGKASGAAAGSQAQRAGQAKGVVLPAAMVPVRARYNYRAPDQAFWSKSLG
jgi:hypothetical protein